MKPVHALADPENSMGKLLFSKMVVKIDLESLCLQKAESHDNYKTVILHET